MAATAIDLQPYASLNDGDCNGRIVRAKQALGDRIVVLGHHYQCDDVANNVRIALQRMFDL